MSEGYVITLRFVHGTEVSSELIEWRAGLCLPWAPSHVESVRDDGKYVGQHSDGGMQAREPGYDNCKPEDELFVKLPATFLEWKEFNRYVDAAIGQPYDWKAIIGFVLPELHTHTIDTSICSAMMYLALRAANWFPSRAPVAVPAHAINPRDLLFAISCIVPIDFDRKASS